MRTRANDWLDTNTLETKYGIDVLHDGKWKHLAEDGKPCIYSTPAERDAKRAEYRKKSMPPNDEFRRRRYAAWEKRGGWTVAWDGWLS